MKLQLFWTNTTHACSYWTDFGDTLEIRLVNAQGATELREKTTTTSEPVTAACNTRCDLVLDYCSKVHCCVAPTTPPTPAPPPYIPQPGGKGVRGRRLLQPGANTGMVDNLGTCLLKQSCSGSCPAGSWEDPASGVQASECNPLRL